MIELIRNLAGAGFLIAGIVLFLIALAEFQRVRWAWRYHLYPDFVPACWYGGGSALALLVSGWLLRIL